MTFYGRSEWGAAPPKYPYTKIPKPVARAFQHHSVTGKWADPAATVKQIQTHHQDVNGWNDIAYNELDDRFGNTWAGRGADNVGGATAGHNYTSLSRCALGNFQTDDPPQVMIDSLVQQYTRWIRGGRLTIDFTLSGHRDESATACPGINLYAKLPRIRARVAANVTEPDPDPEPGEPEDEIVAAKDEILSAIDTLAVGTVQALAAVQAPQSYITVDDSDTEWYLTTGADGRPVRVALPGPPVRQMLVNARFLEPDPIKLTEGDAYWFGQLPEVPYSP